jgi:hypothetical protein
LNNDPTFPLVSASDHRLVYLDVEVTAIAAAAVRQLSISKQAEALVLNWKTQPSVAYAVQETQTFGMWEPTTEAQISLVPETQSATALLPASGLLQKFYRVACSVDVPSAVEAAERTDSAVEISPGKAPSRRSVRRTSARDAASR